VIINNQKEMNELEDSGRYRISVTVFIIVFSFLAVVQLMLTGNPIILLERFLKGGGWIEILLVSCYGAFVSYKMRDPFAAPQWRLITWTTFCVVFFLQLALGLLGAGSFLMTGKLHLPIPFMIISGPVYRGDLSIMTILFLSTVILSGPAWCSQLCYFGAFDNLAARGKPEKEKIKGKKSLKASMLISVILVTILLRWLGVPVLTATLAAIGFGIAGILVMLFFSRRKGKMIHCILYCPVGTLVNLFRYVSPFRLYIDDTCTMCMRCSVKCRYDALSHDDIRNKKPDFSCTLCGDCLAACHDNSIKYKFLRLKPDRARDLYLILTVSLHAIFLALARI
jgi:polyferredoxin